MRRGVAHGQVGLDICVPGAAIRFLFIVNCVSECSRMVVGHRIAHRFPVRIGLITSVIKLLENIERSLTLFMMRSRKTGTEGNGAR